MPWGGAPVRYLRTHIAIAVSGMNAALTCPIRSRPATIAPMHCRLCCAGSHRCARGPALTHIRPCAAQVHADVHAGPADAQLERGRSGGGHGRGCDGAAAELRRTTAAAVPVCSAGGTAYMWFAGVYVAVATTCLCAVLGFFGASSGNQCRHKCLVLRPFRTSVQRHRTGNVC